MATIYRRSQFGRILAGLFTLGIVLTLAGLLLDNGNGTAPDRSLFFGEGLLVAAFFVFTRMTVTVTEHRLEARFGLGLLKRRVPLEEIASVEETRIPWYALGIKRIRGGWAWGVAPGPALDLLLHSGRVVRIGTDDPEGLLVALENASGKILRSPS